MGNGPGSPFDLKDKAPPPPPPQPPGCLITTNKQTRGLDTIQATSFFPWWLLLFFQEHFEAKEDLCKILKSGKFLRNPRSAKCRYFDEKNKHLWSTRLFIYLLPSNMMQKYSSNFVIRIELTTLVLMTKENSNTIAPFTFPCVLIIWMPTAHNGKNNSIHSVTVNILNKFGNVLIFLIN